MLLWALFDVIFEKRLLDAQFINRDTGKAEPANFWFIVQYLGYYHGTLWGLFLLAFVMLFVVFAFACHHTQLAFTNTTTNERSKRSALIKAIEKHERRAKQQQSIATLSGGTTSSRGKNEASIEAEAESEEDTDQSDEDSYPQSNNHTSSGNASNGSGSNGNGNGNGDSNVNGSASSNGDRATKKRTLKISLPSRKVVESSPIYHRGFLANLTEVFYPHTTDAPAFRISITTNATSSGNAIGTGSGSQRLPRNGGKKKRT